MLGVNFIFFYSINYYFILSEIFFLFFIIVQVHLSPFSPYHALLPLFTNFHKFLKLKNHFKLFNVSGIVNMKSANPFSRYGWAILHQSVYGFVTKHFSGEKVICFLKESRTQKCLRTTAIPSAPEFRCSEWMRRGK